jgi:hypothetical protein
LFDAENYLYFNQNNFLTDEKTKMGIQFVRERVGVDKKHVAIGFGVRAWASWQPAHLSRVGSSGAANLQS